jgi:hypothetical protein
MQIVIEIPDDDAKFLMESSFIPVGYFDLVHKALHDGIVLPKNHGDLIDRDLLRNKISEDKRKAFTKHEVWLLASKYNTDVPVIVPADKDGD